MALHHITSLEDFQDKLSSTKIVIVDFWATWCGPCKAIGPVYERLAESLSSYDQILFTKVDVDAVPEVAQQYGVRAMPTFMVFEDGERTESVVGADPARLSDLVKKIGEKVVSSGSSSQKAGKGAAKQAPKQSGGASSSAESGEGGSKWLGASLPRGYSDATSQVEVRGLDLLNADGEAGSARVLFEGTKPSGLSNKGKGKAGGPKDWIESDTDEQLMLYIPFQSTIKAHTVHLTSLPPAEADDDEEIPMRPRKIKVYTNRSTNMGFDEADSVTATQEFELEESAWDKETGTAKLELRFVKFQNITSIVIFVVDGDGDGEKTRIDRVRIVGEVGEKREMGKLEKVGDN